LPDSLRGTIYYEPTDRGLEQKIAQRLAEIRSRRSAGTGSDSGT
jgi:putative ATPase